MAESEWTFLKNYGSRFDAELDRALLDEAGILVLEKAPTAGMWGAGYVGETVQGVSLFVPLEQIDEAKEILGLDEA